MINQLSLSQLEHKAYAEDNQVALAILSKLDEEVEEAVEVATTVNDADYSYTVYDAVNTIQELLKAEWIKEDVLKDLKRKAKGKEHSHNKTSSLYAEYETRLKTGWIRVIKDLSEDLDYIGDSFGDVYSAFVKRNKLK